MRAGVDIIRLWPQWIPADPELVQKVHQLGKPVWATASDAPREKLEALIKLGVRGILSDLPKVLSKLLADMKQAAS